MDLITISEVSKSFKVSTRTLRYYEQIGLLRSSKKEGYAYRVYDEESILRLQQIIVLRNLQIPLKQIAQILDEESDVKSIQVFKSKVLELTDKINALSVIRAMLISLAADLKKNKHVKAHLNLLSNDSIHEVVEALSLPIFYLKEDKFVENSTEALKKLQSLKNVRIVHLPPFTVAASHYIGKNPEDNACKPIERFIRESNLYKIKPDARVFGFNHPNPAKEGSDYGYELWVTIPEDMDIPKPLQKKHFAGGLYAAHMITLGDFHEWQNLRNWVIKDNPKYEANTVEDGGECMNGLLEESLNFVYYVHQNLIPANDEHQLDLLYPIKLKK